MARSVKFDWTKAFALALLLGIVGYVVGRPYIEKWFGWSLPVILEEERELAGASQRNGVPDDSLRSPRTADVDRANGPAERQSPNTQNKESPESSGRSPSEFESSTWRLKEIGADRFQSPAGLVYGIGPQGEHRVEHVMRHAEDDPNRPTHGVFEGTRDEILKLIDEAFELTRQRSNRVLKSELGDRVEYTIKMNRVIGYVGGKSGQRDRFPKADKLKLILESGNQVITAYPIR